MKLLILLALCLLGYTAADIPVRCLPTQFRHNWLFTVLPFPKDREVTPDVLKNECTPEFLRDNKAQATYFRGQVMQPNRVRISKVVQPRKRDERFPALNLKNFDSFDMTMMSDQGFDMINERYSFFNFFSYLKHEFSGDITSQCDRTQAGWFADADKKLFGCFIAYKEKPEKGDVITHRPISEMINREDNLSITADDDEAIQIIQDDNDLFVSDLKRIDQINNRQKLWEAGVYPHFEKMTVGEVRQRGGFGVRAHELAELANIVRQSSKTEVAFDDDDDSRHRAIDGSETFISKKKAEFKKLPKTFDWRNVNGESFISPVRDQGACGSCYAMATLDALEARVRISTKNEHKLDLSVQNVLSCSPYSQQCNGGYPLGVARFVSDFGVVTEECMPYKAENGTCTTRCAEPKILVRSESYNYVGGFLGAGNEEDMMFEIYKNGPIVASFFVHDDFKYYKNGIYTHVEGKAGKKGKINPIEVTSHSVCIIGWDLDEKTGQKSWIVKNSWSKLFGEEAPKDSPFYKIHCSDGEYCGGFFRIRRGVDESAIESAAVSFIPKLIVR